MAVNDLLDVIHTTVANFDGIPVEDFSKFVVFGKVFIYWIEKFVSDISTDVFAEGVWWPIAFTLKMQCEFKVHCEKINEFQFACKFRCE